MNARNEKAPSARSGPVDGEPQIFPTETGTITAIEKAVTQNTTRFVTLVLHSPSQTRCKEIASVPMSTSTALQ